MNDMNLAATGTGGITVDASANSPDVTVMGKISRYVPNVVLNGGFEAGSTASWETQYAGFTATAYNPVEGSYDVYVSSPYYNPTYMQQEFSPVSGIELRYWIYDRAEGGSFTFEVYVKDGTGYQLEDTILDTDLTDYTWFERVYDLSSYTDVQGIKFSVGGTSLLHLYVDAVSITADLSGGGVQTIDAGSGTWRVGGDVDLTNISFNPGTSELILDGPEEAFVYGNNSFYDLVCTTPGKTIRFEEGKTQSVQNELKLAGDYGNPIILRSTTDSSPWNINLSGSLQGIYNADVQDSNATGSTLYAKGISVTAAQNNTNWQQEAPFYWTGAVDTSWGNAANWSGPYARYPGAGDYAVFNASSTQNCTFGANVNIGGIATDGYTRTINTNGYALDTYADLTIATGAVSFIVTGTVTIGTNYNQSAGTFSQGGDFSVIGDYSLHGGTFTIPDHVIPSNLDAFSVGGDFYIKSGTVWALGATPGGIFNRYIIDSGYYMIRDVYDLQAIKSSYTVNYRLNNDVDASQVKGWNTGAGFDGIGNGDLRYWDGGSSSYIYPYVFRTEFDGQGHTISEFYGDGGLFSYIGGSAYVKNVGLVDVEIDGTNQLGGIVNYAGGGTIDNCYVTGVIESAWGWNGGLVGRSYATIINSHADVEMRCAGDGNGGLVGRNHGTIDMSYATGDVNGGSHTGGLVGIGEWDSVVSNSYATGDVKGGDYTGGLVGGQENATILNSYATGSVSGGRDVGGLTGYNSAQFGTATMENWDFFP